MQSKADFDNLGETPATHSKAEIDEEVLRSIRQLLTTVAAAAELLKMRRPDDGMEEACERVRVAALELETRLAELGVTFDNTLLT